MKNLYEELTKVFETQGQEAADKFYNEKIIPLLKKENKKMRKQKHDLDEYLGAIAVLKKLN